MHILVVTDQHPDSLGGAQVAIRAQRASLERAGHRVSIAAPALHRVGYEVAAADRDAYIGLSSIALTKDREYGITWPGRRARRELAAALADRPAVDLVHVQGDFWGAIIGVRAARDLGVPLVCTLHNNVDQGTRAVTPLAPLAFAGLRAWRRLVLGRVRGNVRRGGQEFTRANGERPVRARGAWRYLAELTAEASVVIAPSQHFADTLTQQGVADEVTVVRGGVDDELIDTALALPRSPRVRPRLAWLGRMSHEKRVLEFIAAVSRSGIDADVQLFGAGLLLGQVQDRIAAAGLGDRVKVMGPVPHAAALAALRDADALVQTSVGFETQGLTPFEAAALGTPTVFCDPAIAADLSVTPAWVVGENGAGAQDTGAGAQDAGAGAADEHAADERSAGAVAPGSGAATAVPHTAAPTDAIDELARTLRAVVTQIAATLNKEGESPAPAPAAAAAASASAPAAASQVRVSAEQSRRLMQSEQTKLLIGVYEEVLAEARNG
ncbi:MAG: glycosyltransferase family 4 protein [Leucobacter sp.]|nr:glycosyltransferase family 4 protein [Leucobacter sp.]